MSWSLSASGHAEVEQAEQLLMSDLKEVLKRHAGILSMLSFSGSAGTLTLDDVIAKDVVIPLIQRVEHAVEDIIHSHSEDSEHAALVEPAAESTQPEQPVGAAAPEATVPPLPTQ